MTVTVDRDEETPLLRSERPQKSFRPTPLPWLQLSALFLLQQAEYMTPNATYPFMPDLVRNIGITKGEEKNVGFYVGMLQTAFYFAATVTVFHCCRLSDHVGRRPVLLTGVFGLCVAMCAFGLSTTFSAILVCQLLIGALNGTTGVIKSILVEITDSTNIALAWGYLNTSWCVAASLGSVIGGSLSRPTDQLPRLFGSNQFLKKYPYFLPCTVCSVLLFISWLVGFLFLRETVNQPIPPSSFKPEIHHTAQPDPLSSSGEEDGNGEYDGPATPPLRVMLTPKVLLAAINFATLSFIDIAIWAIRPVFLSTPIRNGGLGLTPRAIGTITSIYNILTGFCQMFIFPSLHDRLGSRNLFILGIFTTIPTYALWPAMNQMARQGYFVSSCFALALQIFFSVITQMAFGASMILIAESPPNRASLGATVGFCQMAANVVRTIGPAVFNSLFSMSINSEYLGGHLVYFVLIAVAMVALYMAFLLPRGSDGREGLSGQN